MADNAILKQIIERLDNANDLLEPIYIELTRAGAPTIKGLLQELEKRGSRLEETILPKFYSQLLDIEKAILASALLIVKPKNPKEELEKAYKAADEFLK